MPDEPLRRVGLALMAHPDDAEILCAGTLMRLGMLGWELHVTTMTAGDCGTTEVDRWQIMAIRTFEAREAAKIIGATYHCLGEPDGFVVYDKPTIRKTIDLFRVVAPTVVFTHALRDYMMDHEMTALLARCATQIFGAPNASEVPIAGGSMHTAPIPHLYYNEPIERIGPLGEPAQPTVLVDIADVLDRKTQALACHASQREWLRKHQGLDEYIDAVRRHAKERGALIGSTAAEGFVQHRSHGYPKTDLLMELFGNKN
jgi:LmbE family N-acetylglucosaminyl deacetylase